MTPQEQSRRNFIDNNITPIFGLVDDLSRQTNEAIEDRNGDCITSALIFNVLANQELMPKTLDHDIDFRLGFIFDITPPEEYYSKPSFHVSNFVIASATRPEETFIMIEADGFYADSKIIRLESVKKLLKKSKDPDNAVVYKQTDFKTGKNQVKKSKTLRPAPFKLDKLSHRSVFLGEKIGETATKQMRNISHQGLAPDKRKLPVLLMDWVLTR